MPIRDTVAPRHQTTQPSMFYPAFELTADDTLYRFTGEGLPLPANTPVTLLARPKLLGQPNLVYYHDTNTCPGGAYAAVSDLYLADYTPGDTVRTIELHFLNIDAIYVSLPTHTALMATASDKDAALAKLQITRQPGQPHLSAWVLAMARLNGLPEVLPQTTIADAAFDDPAIAKWIWFLA